MESDVVAERAFAWLDGVASKARDVTWPVYQRTPRKPFAPLGSAVLLMLRDEPFLVTAAHVIDASHRGVLHLATPMGSRFVRGKRYVTKKPASGDRSHDQIDLAVLPLAAGVADAFPPSAFARWDDLAPAPDEAAPENLLLCGYPASLQPKRQVPPEIKATPYALLGSPVGPAAFAALQLSAERHVSMAFDKYDSYRVGGRVNSPDLYGMSGCGLWFLNGPLGEPHVRPRLAAIATEWHRGMHKCVLATRLIGVLASVFDHLGLLPSTRPT